MNTLPAIHELSSIMQVYDLRERCERYRLWQEKYLVSLETTQLVIDRKYLTLEFEAELQYAMATKMAEELMQECIKTIIKDNEVTMSLLAIRRI